MPDIFNKLPVLSDTEQADMMTVSWKNFFVHVAGKTNDAHLAFVEKFRDIGKIQVEFPGESDFLLVFCPVVSRVGTDINVALQSIPGGKPVILVVMHHTFDHERVVAPSSRQVENPNVRLTVDCLFHDRRLLPCKLNDNAWLEIEAFLGFFPPEDSFWKEIFTKYVFTKRGLAVAVAVGVVMLWYQGSWWSLAVTVGAGEGGGTVGTGGAGGGKGGVDRV